MLPSQKIYCQKFESVLYYILAGHFFSDIEKIFILNIPAYQRNIASNALFPIVNVANSTSCLLDYVSRVILFDLPHFMGFLSTLISTQQESSRCQPSAAAVGFSLLVFSQSEDSGLNYRSCLSFCLSSSQPPYDNLPPLMLYSSHAILDIVKAFRGWLISYMGY